MNISVVRDEHSSYQYNMPQFWGDEIGCWLRVKVKVFLSEIIWSAIHLCPQVIDPILDGHPQVAKPGDQQLKK
jgi:hypothetical protein